MKPIRRILFAVKDPSAARQPGIDKAIQVARAFGASLELFHALSAPVYLDFPAMMDATLDQVRRKLVDRAHSRLAKFETPARKLGVNLEHSVEWDYPPHEAVVRRAQHIGADLIVAECHKGIRTRPWLIHLTDWELLRTSPLPVLLFKSGRRYRHPLIMAAVDPGHAHAKPLDLDSLIVGRAREFGRMLRGSLNIMYASHPSTFLLALGDPTINGAALTATYDELKKQESAAFEEFVAKVQVPGRCTHLVDGHPEKAIPALARKLGAGIVVMGAESRSGLKRVFIGNTAERVLSALPCDVLVVKPEDFKARVANESRGMRIVSSAATPLVA